MNKKLVDKTVKTSLVGVNGVSHNILNQAQAAEDWYRKIPQRLAKAHMYIKDNELDIKIYQVHDELVIEGKDVKKKSKHFHEILKILNGGTITNKPW